MAGAREVGIADRVYCGTVPVSIDIGGGPHSTLLGPALIHK